MKEYGKRLRLTPEEVALIERNRENNNDKRVLVIGDLHAPFIKEGYLEHCLEVQERHQTNHTIFIGDIIDNHYSSFHATDPDGFGAGEELDRAINQVLDWYYNFPEADVVIGNHDRIIMRKAFASGISARWIKDFNEVLETPQWNFDLQFEYDGVMYIHGEGGGGEKGALTKALNKRKSIVQGHWHTQNHINWNVSEVDRLFAMQIGCGIDDKAYALAYAKYNVRKSILSCGVVLEGGKLPILEPMRL
jgi:predicted phosphodiesterase